jgi:hypothetical protein
LGSSDTVQRRAERVEERQFIEGATRTTNAWLTSVKATRSVQYATFRTTEASCLLLRYSSRLRSSDTVERRAEQVEVRQFIEGSARPPSKRLDTTFNATRPVQYATFGTTEASCLFLSYSSRFGSSDTVKRRAEPVEVRQFIEGAVSPPSAWLTTFNATRSVLYATFGTTEDRCHLSRYSPRLGSSNTAERRAERVKNRGDPPARQALGSPPSTRPARRCTLLFGLPRIDALF